MDGCSKTVAPPSCFEHRHVSDLFFYGVWTLYGIDWLLLSVYSFFLFFRFLFFFLWYGVNITRGLVSSLYGVRVTILLHIQYAFRI
jgi:hypothetical protein